MSRALCALATVAVVILTGCDGELPADQLGWCAQHQDDVARSALTHGLMQDGQSYSQWKAGEAGAYRQACAAAFDESAGS